MIFSLHTSVASPPKQHCSVSITILLSLLTRVVAFLVLLDLSSAFDTIDHSKLFTVLGKHVGTCNDALNLIVSYLSDRKQLVRIDNIMSDLASIICGVPQGSVLGPLKFCLYLLPLCSILKHHNIGYHIYADETQLYISFKCNDPLATLPKLNSCISDIRVRMIKNKLTRCTRGDARIFFCTYKTYLYAQN